MELKPSKPIKVNKVASEDKTKITFTWDKCTDSTNCIYEVKLMKDNRIEGRVEQTAGNEYIKFQPLLGCEYQLHVR